MFPQGFVAPLVFCAATCGLEVHQRYPVTALGDQRRWIGLEERGDHLVSRIAITGIENRTLACDQAISRRLSENSILGDLAIVNSTTYEVKKAE
jgi:hypothetical protein